MDAVPPVVDAARQTRIESLTGGESFSMFNIVALVVIGIAIFFLYKRFKDKQATTMAHMMAPSPVIPTPVINTAPVVEETNEVKEE
jgi:LPXTG-motif cell wall-anchored protein